MARLEKAYSVGIGQQDVFPPPILSTSAPSSSDVKFPIGQVRINTSDGKAYILTQIASGSATWSLMSPGNSDVDTLTGDSGGALSPSSGNITLAGGTNVTTAGSGSTITINLDDAIVLATSVSAPLYTVAAANDLAITSAAGQDIVLKMGDNAGANKVSFVDSDDSEVWSVDSNGGVSFTALTCTDLTATGTAVDLGNSNSATTLQLAKGTGGNTVSINNGVNTGANTVNIASGAAAANSTVNILNGNGTAGTQTLNVLGGTRAGTLIYVQEQLLT